MIIWVCNQCCKEMHEWNNFSVKFERSFEIIHIKFTCGQNYFFQLGKHIDNINSNHNVNGTTMVIRSGEKMEFLKNKKKQNKKKKTRRHCQKIRGEVTLQKVEFVPQISHRQCKIKYVWVSLANCLRFCQNYLYIKRKFCSHFKQLKTSVNMSRRQFLLFVRKIAFLQILKWKI